jgi:hypothetical protein
MPPFGFAIGAQFRGVTRDEAAMGSFESLLLGGLSSARFDG